MSHPREADIAELLWDGLIIAAAERGRCAQVYSEDLPSGRSYFDVQVVNPFALPDGGAP